MAFHRVLFSVAYGSMIESKRSPNLSQGQSLKVGFVSLGCPKNLVDTEVMMGQLTARGHELTPTPEEADAIVVNTCSFIDPAKQESVDASWRWPNSRRRAKRSASSWLAAWWNATGTTFRKTSRK